MSDVAKKTRRRVTIDDHEYEVRPLSLSVIREVEAVGFDPANPGSDQAKAVEGLIGLISVRLAAVNGAPDAAKLLTELAEEQIGVDELVELADVIGGENPDPPA